MREFKYLTQRPGHETNVFRHTQRKAACCNRKFVNGKRQRVFNDILWNLSCPLLLLLMCIAMVRAQASGESFLATVRDCSNSKNQVTGYRRH